MPKAYGPGSGRELHGDWLPGFRWAPRKWTFYPFPVPAFKFYGNMLPDFIEMQPGYPTIPGTTSHIGYRTQPDGKFVYSEQGTPHLFGYHPVPKVGQWIVLGPYIPRLGKAIPLYFATSRLLPKWLPWVGGKRLHFNVGAKVDVTLGDNGWWIPDASFTITNPK